MDRRESIALYVVLFLFSIAQASAEEVQFTWQTSEGLAPTLCHSKPLEHLPDLEVSCDTPFGSKVYLVHLFKKDYPASKSTELLYWVTDRSQGEPGKRTYHSVSAWLRHKDSGIKAATISQGVENDFAQLILDWRFE